MPTRCVFGANQESEMTEMTKANMLMKTLDRKLAQADEVLAKWIANFGNNEEYAFRWSDDAMMAANTKNIIVRTISLMAKNDFVIVHGILLEELLRSVSEGKSTSAASNAMAASKTEALKRLYEDLKQFV